MIEKPSDYLRRARELVQAGHCKGYFSVDSSGRPVEPSSDEAVAYCMTGALERALIESTKDRKNNTFLVRNFSVARMCLVATICRITGDRFALITEFNDTMEKEDVVKALELAIELSEL